LPANANQLRTPKSADLRVWRFDSRSRQQNKAMKSNGLHASTAGWLQAV
jgi:hypothetical protein